MPRYRDARAWIEVDGAQLPEYDTHVSDDGVITCWIPCEAGKNFHVYWKRKDKKTATRGTVMVDGTIVSTRTLPPNDIIPIHVKAQRISLTKQRLLQFSTITLTDDDNFLNQPISPQLAQINVSLVKGHVKSIWRQLENAPRRRRLPGIIMHERTKKGIVHCCKLGDEVERTQGTYRTRYNLNKTSTHCSFVFKYRSLDWLIAQGIAPAPIPTNNRSVQEEPIEISDDEDVRRDEEEIISLKTRLKDLETKQQKRNKSGAAKMEVKLEPENLQLTTVSDVIDLT